MSMTDQASTPAPKPKRKYRRRRPVARAAAPPAAPKVPKEFAGITVRNCPDACYRDGKCCISGSVCAHPAMSGLQAALATPDVLARFARAKRVLGEQKLDLTEVR